MIQLDGQFIYLEKHKSKIKIFELTSLEILDYFNGYFMIKKEIERSGKIIKQKNRDESQKIVKMPPFLIYYGKDIYSILVLFF